MMIGAFDTVFGNQHHGWWLVGPRIQNVWTGKREPVDDKEQAEHWAVYRKEPKGRSWYFLDDFYVEDYDEDTEDEALSFACAQLAALMDEANP